MENTIKIYNSLTRKKDNFEPLNPPQVKMYVCGPTVYDQPHIGHARSAYVFDVIRRYLAYRGYKVKFARNVTDVDDKIIEKAKKEYPGEDLNLAVKKVSEKYLGFYHQDVKLLGILEPDLEPKATQYLASDKPLMQNFIAGLIEKGAAYASAGNVYFDIKKAKNYGKLSNQSLDKMESGARVMVGENKRDSLDFALWKSAKPEEPSWDSPWGKGRPGWHIECSVMSCELLGDEFDIHGGGLDLIFPHHENELAQSEAAGKKFARYWIHHGLLTIEGQKMSKSLGNFITIGKILEKFSPDILKMFFLSALYSHPLDFSWEKIEENAVAYERIIIFLEKAAKKEVGLLTKPPLATNSDFMHSIDLLKDRFREFMNDDFNMPQGLSCLFDIVKETNKKIDLSDGDLIYAGRVIKEIGGVFGLSFSKKQVDIETELYIKSKIEERNTAKKAKDFKRADEIRKELEAKGVIIEDTKEGTSFRVRTVWLEVKKTDLE